MTHLVTMAADLALPADVANKLNNFIALFIKWNRSINLSGARTDDQVELHVVDCMHAIPHLRAAAAPSAPSAPSAERTTRVLDVGAGGGLPSIVAALCLPTVEVTALEPVHKKVAFLRVAARELSIKNFVVRPERLEDHGPRDYDAAMSRATFDLREWLLLGQTYVRPGGAVLGFEAVPRADLPNDTQRHPYSLDEKSRSIVVLQRHH
jgi:16S rRNA (guanine527-N7)-methyltransferase